jgi:hypothetical protein
MIGLLEALPGSQRSTLIVVGPGEEQGLVYRGAGNISNVQVIRAGYVTEAVETIHALWGTKEEATVA